MSEIQLTTESVQHAKAFLSQYLKDAGYEASLDDGTAIYDVLIKAFGLMYDMLQQQADKASGFLSLQKAKELKEVLGADYEGAIDSILSNWFVYRKDGRPTQGTVRLWFTYPTNFLHLVPPEELFKYEQTFFTVAREYMISASDFSVVLIESQNVEQYYIDVDVVSINNVALAIQSEASFASYINNVYFIKAEAASDFEVGKEKESSDEFITRTDKAITTRELISYSAIKTVLTQEFAALADVFVAGHGRAEQIRDIITFDDVAVHVGNKADIYIKAPFTKASSTFVSTVENSFSLSEIIPSDRGVSYIFGVYKSDPTTGARIEVPFTIETTEEFWLSTLHNSILSIDEDADIELEIEYLYSDILASVSSFVTQTGSKVTCYDPIIKALHPVILSFTIQLLPSDAAWAPYFKPVAQAIQNYVLSLGLNTPYSESALLDFIHDAIPELRGVSVPITASYRFFDEKTNVYWDGPCGSYFKQPTVAPISAQISQNSLQFYTDVSFIQIS